MYTYFLYSYILIKYEIRTKTIKITKRTKYKIDSLFCPLKFSCITKQKKLYYYSCLFSFYFLIFFLLIFFPLHLLESKGVFVTSWVISISLLNKPSIFSKHTKERDGIRRHFLELKGEYSYMVNLLQLIRHTEL